MPDDEGVALHLVARRAARGGRGPLVEIGAYQGRSTLYIAAGLAAAGLAAAGLAAAGLAAAGARSAADTATASPRLYSVDHHRGSEEMQAGWPHHDASLVDPRTGAMDSLPAFRATIARAGVEDLVIAVVGDSHAVADDWRAPVSMVFLDGGHGEEIEWGDYLRWTGHLVAGGFLVIHDVFADPADGGRPPYECYRHAIETGHYLEETTVRRGSLRVLRRI